MSGGKKAQGRRFLFGGVFPYMFMLLVLLLQPISVRAGVSAQVDRDRIAIDETLTLTISKDGSSFFSKPDSKVLENDFQIVGSSQSSNTQIINGQMSSMVKWEIVLAPKRVGRLPIPPLEVGGEKTEPIWVMVEKSAPAKTRTDDEATIFIETEVDHDEVHVQSQLIYSLRAYLSVQAQIQDPQQPDLPDALVEKLEDATYNKTVNGKAYKVFERKYAIFPQKSGVLEIPQALVQVTVPTRRRFGGVFDLMDQGQAYQLRGNVHQVRILEKAAEYPAGSVWLPTETLTVGEKWSTNTRELKVGESVTLTIDIFGGGLLASQLPPVPLPELDGIKMYQNKGETENNISSRGIIGRRTETVALIPTRPGNFTLPEIRIPWWDKMHHEVKYAVIPGRELLVSGAAVSEEIRSPGAAPMIKGPDGAEERGGHQEKPQSRIWIVVSGVMALLWFITLGLWLGTRRKLAAVGEDPLKGEQAGKLAKSNNEREMFKIFRDACLQNDPQRVRDAVLSWANSYWPEQKIRTCADLVKVASDDALQRELASLDSFLYGKGTGIATWDAKAIQESVSRARTKRADGKKKESALPSLYK